MTERVDIDRVDRLGVVGFGLMGAGIAEIAARAAVDVVVVEALNKTASPAANGSSAR